MGQNDCIFDRLFTTKPVGEGTGFGLDIVQRIVHNHKGFHSSGVPAGSNGVSGSCAPIGIMHAMKEM
jgi:C4-dicarboxylate-specific signal transduction histidine kinase